MFANNAINESKLIFNEHSKYEKGFSDYFKQQIVPEVQTFEKSRIQSLNRFLITLVISIIALSLATKFGFDLVYIHHWKAKSALLLELIVYIIFIGLTCEPIMSYKENVKKKIFTKIIKHFGTFNYLPNGLPNLNLLYSALHGCDIIPQFNGGRTEDVISGNHKGVNLNFLEAHLTMGSGKSKDNVFDGIILLMGMNKKFNGKTIILKDKGTVKNWMDSKNIKLENVKLEDVEFEKHFEVYSTDQIEARYLLTTAFMQRLLDFFKFFPGATIQASFYRGSLLITIGNYKNMFEPGSIFQPADFIEDSKAIVNQMGLILETVDVLKLDQKIGM